jgi:hypothetical protein
MLNSGPPELPRLMAASVVERTGVDVAAARRDDARGHGAAQAERIADRHHRLADAHLGGIAELDIRQGLVALDLEQREIGLLVAAHQLGLELAPVGQRDGDLVGLAGDMVVGDDPAGRVDDEAGADRLCLLGRTIGAHVGHAALAELLHEALHELLHLLLLAAVRHVGLFVVGGAGLHGHGNVDDRRRHLGGQVREILRARHDRRGGRGRRSDRRGGGEQRRDQRRRRQGRRQAQGGEDGLGLRHELLLRGDLANGI